MRAIASLSFILLVALVFSNFSVLSVSEQDPETSQPKPGLPTVVRKSSDVLQQSATKRVEPVYPPQAIAEGVSGPVVVEIRTDEEGKVMVARALSGHTLLKEAALEAARGWTFTPTRLSGVPVQVIGTITFSFNLGEPLAGGPGAPHSDAVEKEIESLKRKVKEDPKSPRAHLLLGQMYIKANRNQEAIDAFKQAVSLNPNLVEAHYHLGSAYLNQGRYDDAIAELKRAIELNPKHGMAHHSLGDAYSRNGRQEDAISELKEALRYDPDNAETHFLLGHAYFKTGKYQEAIKELKQLPPIEPFRSNAHVWMGLSYFKLGDEEAAMGEHKILETINKSAAEYLLKEMKK